MSDLEQWCIIYSSDDGESWKPWGVRTPASNMVIRSRLSYLRDAVPHLTFKKENVEMKQQEKP